MKTDQLCLIIWTPSAPPARPIPVPARLFDELRRRYGTGSIPASPGSRGRASCELDPLAAGLAARGLRLADAGLAGAGEDGAEAGGDAAAVGLQLLQGREQPGAELGGQLRAEGVHVAAEPVGHHVVPVVLRVAEVEGALDRALFDGGEAGVRADLGERARRRGGNLGGSLLAGSLV